MKRYRYALIGFLIALFSVGISTFVLAATEPATDTEKATAVKKDGETVTNGSDDSDGTPASAPPAAAAVQDDDDGALNLAQPDFTVITMPTTLRLPKYKGAFRVTHRFRRSLGQGDLGDLVGDLFGLDAGASIGLEYRFGIMAGTQVGIYRTSDKTIQFFTEYNLLKQGPGRPFGASIHASIEGTNNFKDSYTPALGLILSHEIGDRAALYVQPIWVNNSNPLPSELSDHNDTFMIGLGARIRFGPGAYVVGELVPRPVGFDPGVTHGSFAVEKRVGGHVFQLNFSNNVGTTFGQVARGGFSNDDWYLGFAISRKFF